MKVTARYPWATRELWRWIDRIAIVYAGVTVTSLYRPSWYNMLVRGLWNSYHLKAKAGDLAPLTGPALDLLADAAASTKPPKGQVIVDRKRGIVHIEIED